VRGVYPGTFDPPTIAHLAVAEAALSQCELDSVDLVVNRTPLGKAGVRPLATRVAMLEAVATVRPWLHVAVTDQLHIADIADGYDVLILGADKWAQVLDPSFYSSGADRDAAVARLPKLALAPRHGLSLPDGCVVLDVDLSHVSSTAARAGRVEMVLPEAIPFL
jgi:cytidyltransferase-like protein